MTLDNVLSVGHVFDYQLTGGESLYGLLPTLNDKFSLNLTEDNYPDQIARRDDSTGLIKLVAISNDGCEIYNFINHTGAGVPDIEVVDTIRTVSAVTTGRPLNFKEEISFLSSVTLNKTIDYNLKNSKIIVALQRVLVGYEYGNWNIVGEGNNIVADFILRYYGPGDGVPEEYGSYDAEVTVVIIDLKKKGLYSTYCLRTKKYHVYDNGYRSGD